MRALLVSVALGGMLTVAAAARAEHHADATAAQTLFERGRSAAQHGDWQRACDAFAESQRLDPGAGTLMNWAMCEAHQNKLASAWHHLNEAAQLLAPGDDRTAFVRGELRKLAERLPYLTLRLSADMPAGARITRGGITLGEPSVGVPIAVDPGRVELLVICPGHHTRRSLVELHEGERLEITLEPGPALSSPATETSESPRGARPYRDESQPPRNLAFSLLAAGSLGAGLGLASGVVVASKQRTADQHCPEHRCDAAGYRAAQAGEDWLIVNTMSWSLGAAALVAGTVLLFVTPDHQREASFRPLSGGGTFVYAGRY
jgi:hypothetical protein